MSMVNAEEDGSKDVVELHPHLVDHPTTDMHTKSKENSEKNVKQKRTYQKVMKKCSKKNWSNDICYY